MGGGWKRILIKLNLISVKKSDSLAAENGNCRSECNNKDIIYEDNGVINDNGETDEDTCNENLVKAPVRRQESTFSNKSWCLDDDIIEDSSNQEWDMT